MDQAKIKVFGFFSLKIPSNYLTLSLSAFKNCPSFLYQNSFPSSVPTMCQLGGNHKILVCFVASHFLLTVFLTFFFFTYICPLLLRVTCIVLVKFLSQDLELKHIFKVHILCISSIMLCSCNQRVCICHYYAYHNLFSFI